MSERKYKHPQVNLRLPEDIKEKVAKLADANGRSANAEMVLAIEAWVESRGIPSPKIIDDIYARLNEIEAKINKKPT
ncbi:Arc family DNA-binding protein [Lonsdalea quercina]|uniref:Arc family DNA-binding protein n=1 Tax=Lonsdalea quercina TaxID=71657 RepID=UPI0039763CAE